MKSAEDFKRSVYAKKLARDLRRQQRRRRLAGAASVLAVAVVCFGLGVFSGGRTPVESTSQAGSAANAGLYGTWTEDDVARKGIEAHDAKKMKPGDILQVAVVIGGDTGMEAELCLTNVGTSSLQVLSVWLTACGSGEQSAVEEEFGDLLFAVINAARLHGTDPEKALNRSCSKFRRRFGYIEENTIKKGMQFKDLSLEEMDSLWDKAKELGL